MGKRIQMEPGLFTEPTRTSIPFSRGDGPCRAQAKFECNGMCRQRRLPTPITACAILATTRPSTDQSTPTSALHKHSMSKVGLSSTSTGHQQTNIHAAIHEVSQLH